MFQWTSFSISCTSFGVRLSLHRFIIIKDGGSCISIPAGNAGQWRVGLSLAKSSVLRAPRHPFLTAYYRRFQRKRHPRLGDYKLPLTILRKTSSCL